MTTSRECNAEWWQGERSAKCSRDRGHDDIHQAYGGGVEWYDGEGDTPAPSDGQNSTLRAISSKLPDTQPGEYQDWTERTIADYEAEIERLEWAFGDLVGHHETLCEVNHNLVDLTTNLEIENARLRGIITDPEIMSRSSLKRATSALEGK